MAEGEDAVDDDTVLDADELPETGGSSGFLLASGCALLGVGLILNRILR
jgi:LPXTG-motif cell wall-anchored protein